MKFENLEKLPLQFQNGKISEKDAINEICSFVSRNYPIYGLHKYDEDFRQDIFLNLLERGNHVLRLFNPSFGDFFTFLFCYVSSLINTKIKNNIMNNMKEKLYIEESIDSFDEKQIKYHRIDFKNFELPKAPYAANKIPPQELREALKSLTFRQKDKRVIVLALKSSYYLTDQQIQRISKYYNIKPEYFYSMVQQCKESLENKKNKREMAMERRNFAYYHHRRYTRILHNLLEDDSGENKAYLKNQYSYKEKIHHHNWTRLNNAFQKGHLYLRPTTKTVANLLGICERQVNYYINCAKRDLAENESETSDISSGSRNEEEP